MIAVKGFNADLACTMGRGTFRYAVGKEYEEGAANCARTGFHCVEEPIEVIRWYGWNGSRYCIVDAGGDIHEDGSGRISCTKLKVIKEIDIQQLGALQCRWMQKHPNRKYSGSVYQEHGSGRPDEKIVVVRGKHPTASGYEGATLFLVKEKEDSREIEEIAVYQIDGREFKAGATYRTDGKEARRREKK